MWKLLPTSRVIVARFVCCHSIGYNNILFYCLFVYVSLFPNGTEPFAKLHEHLINTYVQRCIVCSIRIFHSHPRKKSVFFFFIIVLFLVSAKLSSASRAANTSSASGSKLLLLNLHWKLLHRIIFHPRSVVFSICSDFSVFYFHFCRCCLVAVALSPGYLSCMLCATV